MNSFYTQEELAKLGLKSFGENVLLSRNAQIYGSSNIEIGNNVRIDDFCILSGNIKIGSHIHIGSGSYLFAGDAGIEMEDFSNMSSRCVLYAISDDYSGDFLIGPAIPDEFKNVVGKKIVLKKHSGLGSGAMIMPGVIMAEGSALGAMSFLTKSTKPWKMYFGVPAKILKNRTQKASDLEKEFLEKYNKNRG